MSADVNEAILLVDMTDDHARLQRICTIAQLAHEWAKARRAHLTQERVSYTDPDTGEESPSPARLRTRAKLSGLSARLERACLGPREKKGAPDV